MNRKTTIAISLCLAALVTGGAPLPVFSQEEKPAQENYDNWYQVELIVFKRAITESAYDKESWPKNLALAYPPNVRHLIDPEAQQPAENEMQSDDLSTGQTPVVDVSLPIPFGLLDKSQESIGYAVNALNRERGVSVLFHESWLQPMFELDDSSAIIISGGESFGEHRELEGTVTMSLSRYLHIHTNLWLSEFVANYGQQNEHWPDLPTQPKPLALDPTDSSVELNSDTSLSGNFDNKSNGFDLNFDSKLSERDQNGYLQDYSSLTERPFLIKEIVTMRQSRRMRSGELHYIDHPKLGLLIKVTPYPAPESETKDNG